MNAVYKVVELKSLPG